MQIPNATPLHQEIPKEKRSLGGILVGLFFTLIGLTFFLLGCKITYEKFTQSKWIKTPCAVDLFEIVPDQKNDHEFRTDLKFRYKWAGKTYDGDQLYPQGIREVLSYEQLYDVRETLFPGIIDRPNQGMETMCFVDPNQPEKSSLLPSSVSPLLGLVILLFGGCIASVGIVMIWGSMKTLPPSPRAEKRSESILVSAFYIISAAMGILAFSAFLPDFAKYFSAKS